MSFAIVNGYFTEMIFKHVTLSMHDSFVNIELNNLKCTQRSSCVDSKKDRERSIQRSSWI